MGFLAAKNTFSEVEEFESEMNFKRLFSFADVLNMILPHKDQSWLIPLL
jgi:hypothetical protein